VAGRATPSGHSVRCNPRLTGLRGPGCRAFARRSSFPPAKMVMTFARHCGQARVAVPARRRAEGAVRALWSLQAASRAAASSRLPVMRVVLIVPPIRSHWKSQGPCRTPGAEDLQRLSFTVPHASIAPLPGSPGGRTAARRTTTGDRFEARAVGVHDPDLDEAGQGAEGLKRNRSAVGGPHDVVVPVRGVGDGDGGR